MQRLIHDLFVTGYTTAMRPTLGVAVAGLVLGALSCAAIVRRRPQAVVLPAVAMAGESR